MTIADTPITPYSNHGVPESGRRILVATAEIDQGDGRGHG